MFKISPLDGDVYPFRYFLTKEQTPQTDLLANRLRIELPASAARKRTTLSVKGSLPKLSLAPSCY